MSPGDEQPEAPAEPSMQSNEPTARHSSMVSSPTGAILPAAAGLAVLLAAAALPALTRTEPGPRTRTPIELQMHEAWDRAMYGVPSTAMPPDRFAWYPERWRGWAEKVLEPPTGSRLALLPELLTSSECEALIRLALSDAHTTPGTEHAGHVTSDITALHALADLDGDGGLSAAELTSLLAADAREVSAYLTTKLMCASSIGR